MSPSIISLLRSHRMHWCLTQQELAFLLGLKSPSHVSRLERGSCAPSVKIMLAVEILFGIPPKDMFPQLFDEVETAVIRQAAELQRQLIPDASAKAARKKELLTAVLLRPIMSPQHEEV